MDHAATSRPCSSLHPSATRHKHSCASSGDVCDENCSIHGCEGDVWEVSQAQDLLRVEAGTSLSPPKLKCGISPSGVLVSPVLVGTPTAGYRE